MEVVHVRLALPTRHGAYESGRMDIACGTIFHASPLFQTPAVEPPARKLTVFTTCGKRSCAYSH